ncbi:hypothetical protein CIT292_07493 [Citrobacter youngae ATCC 29220]|uniref:Uncharacterized protein n=1 Tax=Citrobacter youngae ATCC 29220 TaxID=500640 RepID=D4BAJ9_9ENTR|nr:hypothetical protein CIT292_07493 [Citrobacter youngae ATCC 29220]
MAWRKKQLLQVNSFITGKMRRGSRRTGEAASTFLCASLHLCTYL